jgi:hypothetical protein
LISALIAVNAVVLSIALFVVATSHGTPFPNLDFGIGDHWPANHRLLTVVDRTGDTGWHQAVVDAISTWDRGGSALTLTLTTGTGPCRQQRDHIEVCQETAERIAAQGSKGEQGLFVPAVGGHHEYRSAVLLVCSDCDGVDQDRQTVIATHELGHALGLTHNPNPESVMYFVGGSPDADARDYQILRAREGSRSDLMQTAGSPSAGG